ETEDDSTFSLDIYFYDNDLLIKTYDIGIWNTRTNKVDTGTTVYYFNDEGELFKSIYFNTRDTDTLKSTYHYSENLLISRTFYDEYSRVKATDSMYYYLNSTPHIVKRTFFFPDFNSDIRD